MTPTVYVDKALAAVTLIQSAHRPLKALCSGAASEKGKIFARNRFVYSAVDNALRDAHKAFFKSTPYWTESGMAAKGKQRVREHSLPLIELAERWFSMDDLSASTIVRWGLCMPLVLVSTAEDNALRTAAGNGRSLFVCNPWPETPFARYAKADIQTLHTDAGPLPDSAAYSYEDHLAHIRGQSDGSHRVLDHFGL